MSAQGISPSLPPPERPDWLPLRKSSTAVEITDFHPEAREPAAEVLFPPDHVMCEHGEVVQAPATSPISWRRPFSSLAWVIRSGFAVLSLILLLAVIAAIPIVNFIALGYLLEVEGRVARSGRFRDAFPLLEIAPRLGTIVLGVWLWLLPLRLLSGAAADATLIDPSGRAAVNLGRLTVIAAFGTILVLPSARQEPALVSISSARRHVLERSRTGRPRFCLAAAVASSLLAGTAWLRGGVRLAVDSDGFAGDCR
jgi:hypothetical protein